MASDPISGGQAAADPIAIVNELTERIAKLEDGLARANGAAAALASHVTDLSRDLVAEIAALTARAERADTHLLARPYMSSPDALSVLNAQDDATMGFVRAHDTRSGSAYAEFESLFRGSREEIQRRQQLYVELAKAHAPVLDAGCGRGELLELLAGEGVSAKGVDLDAGMVAEAVASGAEASVGDLFAELADTTDGSLGMVFSAQVIEHLQPRDMWRLLEECHRVLREDGVAVIETVNVHSVRAFRFFWLDTTHTVPVFPETLLTMAAAAGFPCAVVIFPHPDPGESGGLSESLAWAGDYAIVAARDPRSLVAAGLLSAQSLT